MILDIPLIHNRSEHRVIMSILREQRLNIFQMQERLWLITKPTGVAIYNFDFEKFFECRHHWRLPTPLTAIARIGAIDEYDDFYESLRREGIHLIHTPEEHQRCGELPAWYPLLSEITPRSVWFDEVPTSAKILEYFDFPLFIKGARQTSKHNKSLSIVEDKASLENLLKMYKDDPILHWQKLVCREYVELKSVGDAYSDEIPPSYEFRTFWWKGKFVGAGRYWYLADEYQWTGAEKAQALEVAQIAAERVAVNFLVVDVAQRTDGTWIVIECNDGQESGYAGLSPFLLWRNIAEIEAHP